MIVEGSRTLLTIQEYIDSKAGPWTHEDSVKRAIRKYKFPAIKRQNRWYIDPKEAALYFKRHDQVAS